MKKIIVLIAFVAGVVTSGYSQFIKKGTILGGGSFEFRSHKDDAGAKQSSLGLMPWGGVMVIDNLAVGGILDVSTSSYDFGGSKSTSSDLLIGPVVRYYMDNGLFGHAQFAVGSGKTEFTGSPAQKQSLSEIKIGAGYAIRISDTVLLEPIVGYLSQGQKDKDTNVKNTESGFFVMGGFTIFFRSTN